MGTNDIASAANPAGTHTKASGQQKPPTIPPHLLRMLEALKPILERQGSLQGRPDTSGGLTWRLRFMEPGPAGNPLQRSFELGGRAEVEAVRLWLRELRRGYQEKVETERRSREEAATKESQKKEQRSALRAYCISVGQSRRQRRDLGKEFDSVADDPRRVIMMCERARVYGPLPPRRVGRPLNRRLW
jgi:hypothetical protein